MGYRGDVVLANTYGSTPRRRRRRLRGTRCGGCYHFDPGPVPASRCPRCGRAFDPDAPALLCWETTHPSGTVAEEWTPVGVWFPRPLAKTLAGRRAPARDGDPDHEPAGDPAHRSAAG